MSENPRDTAEEGIELEAILLRVLDGVASDQESAWLNQSLQESAELRSRACRFLCDDALLADEIGTAQEASALVCKVTSRTPSTLHEQSGYSVGGPVRRTLALVDRHGLAVAAVALFLTLGLAINNLVMMAKIDRLHSLTIVASGEGGAAPEGNGDASTTANLMQEGSRPVIGRVTGLKDVVWKPGATEFRFGDSILRGQTIGVETGILELLLSTGAKLTVEGPAKFEATSALETTFARGKVAAAAPRTARGYTIVTPTTELVDIGTQFGVAVEESGATEVHVFEGDVVARSRLRHVPPTLLHAKENQAMRFVSTSLEPHRFAAQEGKFIRHIAPRLPAAEIPPLPVTHGLAQWYTADTIRNLTVGAPVSTWRDLLVGENDFADDAWQFDPSRCPQLVLDQNDRPALRFDGWLTYLTTSPIDPTDQQTIFIACAPGPATFANEHHGGILLKYDTVPSLELSILKDHRTRGWVWPGPESTANVGIVRSEPLDLQQINVIAYEYDSHEGSAELWVNGQSHGTTTAPLALRQPGRRYIGSHSKTRFQAAFFGNIYEIVIYDQSLEEDELSELWAYFGDRYDIQ